MNFRVALIIGALTVLFGCDCEVQYRFEAENMTNETLIVEYDPEFQGIESSRVEPGQSMELAFMDGHRCACLKKCYGDRFQNEDLTLAGKMNNVKVMMLDSTHSATDFNQEPNWDFESQVDLGVYKAIIDQEDF